MKFFSFFGRKKLHLIGDSHVEPLVDLNKWMRRVEISMCRVPGATASGLQNPHSKTLAGPIFHEYIRQKIQPGDNVLIHLGEVDCGFLMWVRAEREQISIEAQTEHTLNNYFDLLGQIAAKTPNIYVLSILPQTIRDGVKIGNVANLRGHINATQLERTLLSRKMNSRLKNYCRENGMVFIDLDPVLISSETGVVNEYYLNKDPDNHHLDGEKLTALVLTWLRKYKLK